jgi:hypothetical protein
MGLPTRALRTRDLTWGAEEHAVLVDGKYIDDEMMALSL